jgi:hypothetical protein
MHAVPALSDAQPLDISRKLRSDWTPINYDLRDAWFPVSHSAM